MLQIFQLRISLPWQDLITTELSLNLPSRLVPKWQRSRRWQSGETTRQPCIQISETAWSKERKLIPSSMQAGSRTNSPQECRREEPKSLSSESFQVQLPPEMLQSTTCATGLLEATSGNLSASRLMESSTTCQKVSCSHSHAQLVEDNTLLSPVWTLTTRCLRLLSRRLLTNS